MCVRGWYSPFHTSMALEAQLGAVGLERFLDPSDVPSGELLVLYSPPHELLETTKEDGCFDWHTQGLGSHYNQVQQLQPTHPVIATWRLELMDEATLARWIEMRTPAQPIGSPTAPDPVSALITRTLLEAEPSLLDAYLDLELSAELAGGEPDTNYLQRLRNSSNDPQHLLEIWSLPFRQLAQLRAEHQTLTSKEKEASEEAELTLLQLHQVQEELEHYFLRSRAADELAQAQAQQLQRAQAVLARLLPVSGSAGLPLSITPVEVMQPVSLQTEALLDTYSESLRRAASLLQLAMRQR
ncbi:MAG: hypothetical protein VKK94_05345 [Cyanobacteriota bacterium]|nr:hypothetical protein [Cyanobacteriota bacterium]